jgi:hypothetical protein
LPISNLLRWFYAFNVSFESSPGWTIMVAGWLPERSDVVVPGNSKTIALHPVDAFVYSL